MIKDIRKRLNRHFDDPQLEAFLLDYFPEVYDRLGRGMQKNEKTALLLSHCHQEGEHKFRYLLDCLKQEGM